MSQIKPPLWKISLARTPEQIGRCSAVMRELRPHIKAIDFAVRVLQQQKEGYQIAYLELDSGVQRVAAHRFYLNRGMEITSHHFDLKLCR